ncbi:SulP family inorganic anion transporter [Vulgatibacter sp.]|uniref:SulP family inorganic anion transporter n=1 Tax=Vulgatibacter sp. TaxID=1971226 RepID=UPI003565E158
MSPRPPVLAWLPGYRWRDLPRDLFAGLMGTLSTAPEAMAYALLAGLPAQMGLYSLLLPLLVYFVMGTSRELSLAPTATLAAVLAVTLAPLAGGDPARYVALATLVGFLLGGLLLAAGVLRLGYVANFVSRPVLTGYFAGAALLIAASQLGIFFGVHAEGLNLPAIARAAAASWEEAELPSAALGFSLLALLYLLHAIGQRAIGPAVVVVVGTVLVAALEIPTAVIGDIPAGLPPITLPELGGGAALRLMLPAAAIAVLVFLDSSSVARHFANERGYRIDYDQELRALGTANLAAGLTGAAPVSGNLADTIVLEQAGARSPLTALITVVLVLALVLVGADFANVPLVAFAAIVVYGVLRPPHLAALRLTWRFDRAEFLVALICLAGVLGIGLIRGLVLAVALTALVLLARASHPRITEVGFVSEPVPALVARDRVPAAQGFPGALVFQPLGGLFFASASAVTDLVHGRVTESRGLRLVVLDLRTVPFVDITGCDLLAQLQRDLTSRGVRLVAVRATAAVQERFERYGLAGVLELPGGIEKLFELLRLPRDVRDRT